MNEDAEDYDINDALDSYINGNISDVKQWLKETDTPLWIFLDKYIAYSENHEDIILLVKRLG